MLAEVMLIASYMQTGGSRVLSYKANLTQYTYYAYIILFTFIFLISH